MTRRSAVSHLAAAAVPLGDPAAAPPVQLSHHVEADSAYCQAREVRGARRLLFVSGQVPAAADDSVPPDFRSQARLAWANVIRQLTAAGMTLDALVKVTIFLSDRRHRAENGAVRKEVLGQRTPALTIVITGIYDEAWLLEIEAVAAD